MGLVDVGYVSASKRESNPELRTRELLAAGCERVPSSRRLRTGA